MQNRYAGDVGDFGKLGMLRAIAYAGISVGVNWYLVPNESHNEDGKHISYLNDSQFDGCDNALRDALRKVVAEERSVDALEKQHLIMGATYYHELLLSPGSGNFSRANWHKNAVSVFAGSDIVFLDPDNGVLVKSVSEKSSKSNKYVFIDEIIDYNQSGKSVVFYNHRSRQKEPEYLTRFEWMWIDPRIVSANVFGLKFTRGTIRDYFFILQPEHSSKVYYAIENMLRNPWKQHFSLLNINP